MGRAGGHLERWKALHPVLAAQWLVGCVVTVHSADCGNPLHACRQHASVLFAVQPSACTFGRVCPGPNTPLTFRFCATLVYVGARFLQWPHQGAKNSTMAGRSLSTTSAAKFLCVSGFTGPLDVYRAAMPLMCRLSRASKVVILILQSKMEPLRSRTGNLSQAVRRPNCKSTSHCRMRLSSLINKSGCEVSRINCPMAGLM